MPLGVIGMIGVAPPADDATVHVIEGGVSPEFIVEFSRAHERAGFDLVLVGYTATSADGWEVATHAAAHTETLGYLIAHRPGSVAPTLAARKAATFDQLSRGRFAIHIIAGVSDLEQRRDGDFLDKTDRYRRAGEYLTIMRKVWAGERFDFEGEFYRVEKARSDVLPYQSGGPPVFFGGSSPGALEMGAEHGDVYATFAEPRAAVADRMADFSDRAAVFGRSPTYSISCRPILGATEGEAWDRARQIADQLEAEGRPPIPPGSDHSAERLRAHAAAAEVHDERLWMRVAEITGAPGNTSCLVGTAEQVADSILRYYDLGPMSHVLIRGFDPIADIATFGEELIPRIKQGALELDAARSAAT